MLNVSVANTPNMLIVSMLSVVMLNVLAPATERAKTFLKSRINVNFKTTKSVIFDGATTLSTTTLSIITPSIMNWYNDAQH